MTQAINAAVQPVLDARNMGQSAAWWGSLFRLVKQRTGIDMNRQTVPLGPVVGHTIGGFVDGSGRRVVGTGCWFTGLYAAGGASHRPSWCCSLERQSTSRRADLGFRRGQACRRMGGGRKFSTASGLESAIQDAEADLSAMMESGDATHVVRCGTVNANLQAALAGTTSFTADSMTGLRQTGADRHHGRIPSPRPALSDCEHQPSRGAANPSRRPLGHRFGAERLGTRRDPWFVCPRGFLGRQRRIPPPHHGGSRGFGWHLGDQERSGWPLGPASTMKKGIGLAAYGMTTLFERILSGEIPSHEVAKGDGWYAFLDIFPRRQGHTLVIPTRPVQRLAV